MKTILHVCLAASLLGASPSHASDHVDGIKTAIDQAADIADLFTFTSPQDPTKLVLIMNVHPFAWSSSMFSNAVDYRFRIRPIDSKTSLTPSSDASRESDITCTFTGGGLFDSTQQGTCVFNLATKQASVTFATRGDYYNAGGDGSGDGVRVFAGVRSDPWFIDLSKALKYNTGAQTSGPGKNGLQGTNVLSIVVEVDKASLPGSLLAVSAQTVRK